MAEEDGISSVTILVGVLAIGGAAAAAYYFYSKSQSGHGLLQQAKKAFLDSKEEELLMRLRNRDYLGSIETTSGGLGGSRPGLSVTFNESKLNEAVAHAAKGGFSSGSPAAAAATAKQGFGGGGSSSIDTRGFDAQKFLHSSSAPASGRSRNSSYDPPAKPLHAGGAMVGDSTGEVSLTVTDLQAGEDLLNGLEDLEDDLPADVLDDLGDLDDLDDLDGTLDELDSIIGNIRI